MSQHARITVAKHICRAVRTGQGFSGNEHYTLEDEVENAHDLWFEEADKLLAALSEGEKHCMQCGVAEMMASQMDCQSTEGHKFVTISA